jgi:protein SCO1/2
MRIFAMTVSFVLMFGCARGPDLIKLYPVPEFSLTDQTETTVTLQDLKGKVWIADFIFTNCGGTCPMMTDKMRKLQQAIPSGIQMVSFTVDPMRDTPKVLAHYAAEHGASRDRWLFLTGDKESLYELCLKGFKLPLDDQGGTPAEPIAHSTRFVLVDKQGDIRGYYSGTDEEDLTRLAADARKLLLSALPICRPSTPLLTRRRRR